ncbi:parallel beta-helix repeat (two copies) [Thermoplasmatales archaeon SCGC AB-540-F20]|nr:parallel beta-helix repeat (two copies) [Thermoplasmatales archaeon SCGC AB-540-F20]
MKKLLAVGVIVLFLGLAIAPSINADVKQIFTPAKSGNTLYVGGNGTGNYSKIQDAIDNSSNGDTVFVYDDSSPYYENVVVDKSINLTGQDKDTTIIDCNESGDVIYVTADWVNISGFKLQDGQHGGYPYNDAGIEISSNFNTITGNTISNNHYGIRIYNSCNNTIKNNNISYSDYDGLFLRISSNNTIRGNNISNNWIGGIYLLYSTNNTITGNKITSIYDYGIGLRYSSNYNIIYHNNFFNNNKKTFDECHNTWDNGYPSGGNYWDDYTGNDSDGDGIGDTPYPIPDGDNEDRYPLMKPYGMEDENESFFGTLGPICPLLNIAEINLIDGNDSQIQKIEKMLNNRILQFIIPYWWGYINVTELDFTITYTKKIPMMPFWLNFYYATILTENENDTFIDKPHTVTVKGLNGHFVISRGQPFRFRPPYFLFAGETYDEVTIELIERGRV